MSAIAHLPELKRNYIPAFHLYRHGIYWGSVRFGVTPKDLVEWVEWVALCPSYLFPFELPSAEQRSPPGSPPPPSQT